MPDQVGHDGLVVGHDGLLVGHHGMLVGSAHRHSRENHGCPVKAGVTTLKQQALD